VLNPARLRPVHAARKSALLLALSIVPSCDRFRDEAAPAEAKEPTAEATDTPAKPAKTAKTAAKPAKPAKPKPAKAAPSPEPTKPVASNDLIAYVPDTARSILVADPKALARSSLSSGFGPLLAKAGGSELGEVADAAKACGVALERWSSVLAAGDFTSPRDSVLGVKAAGIGKKATIECLGSRLKDTESAWTVSEDAGRVVFDVEGGRGVAVSDDMVLVYGKGYASAVASLLDGKGKSAVDGPLGPTLASVDRSKHVYFASEVYDDMAPGPLIVAHHCSATLDFSSGLAVALAFAFDDPAAASTGAESMQLLFEGAKELATHVGVPASVLATVKIETKDKAVVARFSATNADLEAIATALE
jgi:hypothetical protein